ncbi:MAG: hypothetical protein JSS64_03515 [Bacteroidetes bacterium]|nr:hypothetical protein [Bacteroidota bacterium]
MNYATLENEIAIKLSANSALTDVCEIILLPDSVANYKTPVIKGLVTVAFLGEKFDRNQSIGEVTQHSTLTFNISIQSRLLRESTGVYAISELIKQTLEGLILSDCGALTMEEQQFSGYQNDVWEHSLTFICRTLRTQEYQKFLPSDDVTNGEEIYYEPNNITINEQIHIPG